MAFTRTMARLATHTLEWSSIMFKTSKTVPFRSVTCVMSACQHSFGSSATKRV